MQQIQGDLEQIPCGSGDQMVTRQKSEDNVLECMPETIEDYYDRVGAAADDSGRLGMNAEM